MLTVLAYIWAVFGACWIIFAPALSSSSEKRRLQPLRLAFLASTVAVLLWKAQAIPPVWIMVLGLMWAGLGLYWVSPRKATGSGEYGFYRLVRLLIGAIAFALLFWQKTGVGFLGMRFVPASVEITRMGFGAALLGLVLAAWARVHLGQHWSDRVVIQPDHHLVRTGPYARVRHPIYSGVLLGIAGTAVAVAEWRGVVALVVMLLNYTVKARSEDKMLDECFREEFSEYQQAAGLLFPRLWQHGTGKWKD